jgi:lipopolysaccharide export system protein LptA
MARTPLHILRVAAVIFAAVLLAPVAQAQTTESRMSGLALSGDEPIQIESDLLKINEETSQATFTGNVKVVQGDTVLQAGEMIVNYTNDGGSVSSGTADIREIELYKKVLIRSGTQTATADAPATSTWLTRCLCSPARRLFSRTPTMSSSAAS